MGKNTHTHTLRPVRAVVAHKYKYDRTAGETLKILAYE